MVCKTVESTDTQLESVAEKITKTSLKIFFTSKVL